MAKKQKTKPKGTNINKYQKLIAKIKAEVARVVVGQGVIVEKMILALIANGHVLVEGVPGIAKSLIVKTLAVTTGCNQSRIQFTVDLLPTDIVGLTTLAPDNKTFQVIKGPIFSNFVMADEINRAPPKTQSALLEAMAEKQVSIGKQTYRLSPPFFVMATQNPIESTGTYPLPEAQKDRFLFKLLIDYPEIEDEEKIIEQNIMHAPFESYGIKKIIGPKDIIEMQQKSMGIKHTERINKYIVELVNATRNPKNYGIVSGKYINLGASPRASINLFIAAKASAFMSGKEFVSPQDIKNVAIDVLRHRIMLGYKAQVEKVSEDDIIREILAKVRVP